MIDSPRSDTPTLIAAMEVLSREVACADGVANAAIAEAAERLRELSLLAVDLLGEVRHVTALPADCPGCAMIGRYRHLVLRKDKW